MTQHTERSRRIRTFPHEWPTDVNQYHVRGYVVVVSMITVINIAIVTIRADFQQGMESVSYFKKNTVTEIDSLIYAAATVIMIMTFVWGIILSY